MAFAYTTLGLSTGAGSMCRTWGTFTNASGDSGGTINTGLSNVVSVDLTVTSHYNAAKPKVTITTSSPSVTVVTGDANSGNWVAFGNGI